jgi:hypothetical protein
MACPNPLPPICPTLTGYVAFVRNVVGISDTFLPNPVAPQIVIDYEADIVTDWQTQAITSSGGINWFVLTLGVALELVNQQLQVSPTIYTLAVYNLAADRLINYAQDQPGQTFFQDTRKALNIYAIGLGVVTSASDQGTSMSQLNTDAMKDFTLMDLQVLKTPWGRNYLGFAQSIGAIWGLN